jgi:hypothetical protein
MVIAAIMIGAGMVLVLGAVMRAPVGYQDETGFHMGEEKHSRDSFDCESNPS